MPGSPPPPLTIRELAKLAGVSRSTASLAMQNHPRLTQKTRDHVRKIAAEHGYTPDPLTSTLMSHLRISRKNRGTETLAYLTAWNSSEGWRVSYNHQAMFEGARARAEAMGYRLEHFWAREPGMSGARLSKILYTRAIRGVIIAPLLRPRGHLSLDWSHLATAAIAFTTVKPDLHRATHSHYNGMMMALRRLKHLGYQRIGLANLSDQMERVNNGWLAGYLVYDQSIPSKRQVPPLLLKSWDKKHFAAWMEIYRPDAIVSNHLDPLNFVKELGYSVPDEIGFARLDLAMVEVKVAGIDQEPHLVAAAAVDLVIEQLHQNEFGLPARPKVVHLDGIWKDGETVRRPAVNQADSFGLSTDPSLA